MGERTNSPLSILPVELQYQIICLLDPIGLISLSQSNQHFRYLISPGQNEWREWLLSIECREKYGGGTMIYRLFSDGYIEPNWQLSQWQAHRWLCGACLRFLPHTDFDNHSLLRLPYRKPIPGSPAANDTLTSWVPSLHGRNHGREARRAHREKRKLQGPTPADGPSVLARNHEICGYNRQQRRCNECRFQAGQLGPQMSHWSGVMGGTRKVPILRSREVTFDSPLDRYFPRLSDFLTHKKPPFPPRVMRIQREDAVDEPWAMYMVRCPQCETWQELRSFRFGGMFVNWKPSHDGNGELEFWTSLHGDSKRIQLDDVRCNRCFLKTHGREKLAKELWEWLKFAWILQQWKVEGQLGPWWAEGFLKRQKCVGFNKEIRKLTRDIERLPNRRMYALWGYHDIALFRLQHYQTAEMWERMKMQDPQLAQKQEEADFVETKLRQFEENEAHWRFHMEGYKELEENPDLLVDWALSRKRTASGEVLD
ncbi:unnamed protein product [Clonostachys rosea f. rosea IK726]|uniref:F-box domain-containing protein n=2 Tax=Bionectria ochroleuca TaxID=29856 RepID=A0A8H7K7E8_BIOOC|nr:unnamed protein product [Clonostachys rosea f. rosea IK726]